MGRLCWLQGPEERVRGVIVAAGKSLFRTPCSWASHHRTTCAKSLPSRLALPVPAFALP